MRISIAKTQNPRARLIRLIPVEILCMVCRLSTQSVVSTFDSDARVNPRLKLAVASMGVSLFESLRGGCWFFSLAIPYKSISRAGVSESDEKSEKTFLIR
jgi:hypothetical protein